MDDERIGLAGQRKAPGYGWCERCQTPWLFVEGHVTEVDEHGHGFFPLCNACWRETDLETRLVYYQSAYTRLGWGMQYPWGVIERAVRDEWERTTAPDTADN